MMLLALFLGGFGCGLFLFWIIHRLKIGGFHHLAQQMLHQAELQIKEEEFASKQKMEKHLHECEKKIYQEKERLLNREDALDARLQIVEKRAADIEKREKTLEKESRTFSEEKKRISALEDKALSDLEHLSGITHEQAKALILEKAEKNLESESARMILRMQEDVKRNMENEAARIIATAIGRLSLASASEASITTVPLSNEEIKGRIIGREGRNIRAFEQAAGVNILIDETPHAVVISAFDPIRKHIAKKALAELISDGRIHPTRIEEIVEKSRASIEEEIVKYGESAAASCGVLNLSPELLTLLGQLHFRDSFGQNVLSHSLEVSSLMGLIASELHLDSTLAKRMGLLHDIGKAVSHEMEGSHALVGYELALKNGESEEVANAIGAHHDEMVPQTILASLVRSADALSAGRLGAREEAVEKYIKRMRNLESLISQYEGVEKAYALQAGREIRVIVTADKVSDSQTVLLARALAQKIEQAFSYPGKIKVTVIREKRAVEYAT